MNVEITIENTGTLTFDMTTDQVTKMLTAEFEANACFNSQPNNKTHDVDIRMHNDVLNTDLEAGKIPYKKPEKPRVYAPSNVDGYKGFLLLECPSCGKRKGFCTKTPIRTSFCSCGYEIEIKDLKKARLDCKCGKKWNYMTNIEAQNFTQNCLDCGSPIDVVYNPRHDTYETLR